MKIPQRTKWVIPFLALTLLLVAWFFKGVDRLNYSSVDKPKSEINRAEVAVSRARNEVSIEEAGVPLKGPGSVKVWVRMRDGAPAGGAKVQLTPAQENLVSNTAVDDDSEYTAESGDDGRCIFTSLPVDSYVVTAALGDLGGAEMARLLKGREIVEIEVVLRSGGAVAGSVLDAAGAPIEGARIYPSAHERFAISENLARGLAVRSDGTGTFVFPFLPARSWQFTTEAEGFQAVVSSDVDVGTRDLRVVLEPGCKVAGRVVNSESGAGVGGMVLVARQQAIPVSARVETDPAGSFEFSGLTSGEVQIVGHHESLVLSKSPVTVVAGIDPNEPVLIEACPGARVRGRIVTPDGIGVSGLTVSLNNEHGGLLERTDDDGNYHFENTLPGGYRLGTPASARGEVRRIQVAPDVITEVPDWIVNVGIIRGKVLDRTGGPVPDAAINVSSEISLGGVISDARGEFQIAEPHVQGELQLVASKLDYSSAPATVDADSVPIAPVVLTLDRPSGTIAGQVLDSRGKPTRACLTISSYEDLPISGNLGLTLPDEVGYPAGNSSMSGKETIPWDISLSTDSEGYFLANVDTPSQIKVYLSDISMRDTISKELLAQEFWLAAGESKTELRLIHPLAVGPSIRGRTQDENGLPVPNAQILAYKSEGGGDSGIGRSEVDGKFTIDGLVGERYTVRAEAPGYKWAILADIIPGATELTVTLMRPPTVSGYVTDVRSGKPVIAFEVALVSASKSDTTNAQFQSVNHNEGYFELESVADDREFDLLVQSRGFNPARIKLGKISSISGAIPIPLDTAGSPLDGIVVDENGVAIAGATVAPVTETGGQLSGTTMTATTAADGAFRLAGLPSDTDAIVATHPNYIRTLLSIDPSKSTFVTLTLSAGGTLEGVVSENSQPLEGVRIRVMEAEAAQQVTDAEGRFHFEKLPVGTVTLKIRIRLPDGGIVSQTLGADVLPDSVSTADIIMQDEGAVVLE